MEYDTGTGTATHRDDQVHGAHTESTTTATPPPTSEGKGQVPYVQGNTSRTQTTKATHTPSNDSVTSLADLRPGLDI